MRAADKVQKARSLFVRLPGLMRLKDSLQTLVGRGLVERLQRGIAGVFCPPSEPGVRPERRAGVTGIKHQVRANLGIAKPPKGLHHLVEALGTNVQGVQRRHPPRHPFHGEVFIACRLGLAAVAGE